jgi:hypothetical protein
LGTISKDHLHCGWEITQMRLIAVLALALSLTGCNGDRIKDSMNVPQVQPQTVLS